MNADNRGIGSSYFGGLVFLIGLILVVLAAILPLASEGFEDRWQWTLILVIGGALLAGGLAVTALAMLLRSIPDPRDELTKVSRKMDKVTTQLDDAEVELPAGRRSAVDRAFSRETQRG